MITVWLLIALSGNPSSLSLTMHEFTSKADCTAVRVIISALEDSKNSRVKSKCIRLEMRK